MAEALQSSVLTRETTRRWIESPGFDLAFFILSPLIAVPLLIASPEPSAISIVFACMIGVPHYLSTFVFYFWEDTAAYHRARWGMFFGVPVLIAASVWVGLYLRIPYVIQVVIFVWNVFHVARQSTGILSIYRMRAGVTDPAVRPVVNSAVIWSSAAMAFWNTAGHPQLHPFLLNIWSGLPRALFAALASLAVVSVARLAWQLVRRFRSDRPPAVPEMLFLATSLALFHPYLWIHNANAATLGMLLGHFIQYLAIVWLVHRRRYATASEALSPLSRISVSLPLLLLTILGTGTLALGFNWVGRTTGSMPLQVIYGGFFLAVSLVHFYLDGLFWAMRRPEVRRSIGPYLMS